MSTVDDSFLNRFDSREQVQRYLDRFQRGRRRLTDAREKSALVELMGDIGKGVVLDLPCGPGRFVPVWAKLAEHVILADASPAVVQFVGEHLPANGSCLETRAEAIPLAKQSVDVVFSHRFLHHVRDQQQRASILLEFHRVTRRYLILPFYPPGLRSRARWWWRARLGRVAQQDLLRGERQFLGELGQAGFRLARWRRLRRFPASAFFLFDKSLAASG